LKPSIAPGLRERKKAQTRHNLQQQALRLFSEKGYEATTVEQIAAAAGVSSMTFFRYFPTKEDVVLSDDYDDLLTAQIEARPADEPALLRVQVGARTGLALVYAADREGLLLRTRLILRTPALRARLWEQQTATEQLIARALATRGDHREDNLRLRVAAAACMAAVTTAVLLWAEEDGARELPDLIDEAFTTLRHELV